MLLDSKRPGCGWKDSPWVWAIGFKVVAEALVHTGLGHAPCDARTAARARAKEAAAGEAEANS